MGPPHRREFIPDPVHPRPAVQERQLFPGQRRRVDSALGVVGIRGRVRPVEEGVRELRVRRVNPGRVEFEFVRIKALWKRRIVARIRAERVPGVPRGL